MPHRRARKSGSFDAHLDELVRHFDVRDDGKFDKAQQGQGKEDEDLHERLFASAWRQDREQKR